MNKKTWLCLGDKKTPKCIHSKIYKKTYYSNYGNMKTVLIVECHAENILHFIHKFIVECDKYNNVTLFDSLKKPQFLPKKEYNNECECCKGRGYKIVKIPNVVQRMYKDNPSDRFKREFCVLCNGKGIKKCYN